MNIVSAYRQLRKSLWPLVGPERWSIYEQAGSSALPAEQCPLPISSTGVFMMGGGGSIPDQFAVHGYIDFKQSGKTLLSAGGQGRTGGEELDGSSGQEKVYAKFRLR